MNNLAGEAADAPVKTRQLPREPASGEPVLPEAVFTGE